MADNHNNLRDISVCSKILNNMSKLEKHKFLFLIPEVIKVPSYEPWLALEHRWNTFNNVKESLRNRKFHPNTHIGIVVNDINNNPRLCLILYQDFITLPNIYALIRRISDDILLSEEFV